MDLVHQVLLMPNGKIKIEPQSLQDAKKCKKLRVLVSWWQIT